MNSFPVNRSSSIHGVLTTFECQPVATVSEKEPEVLNDVGTMLAGVR